MAVVAGISTSYTSDKTKDNTNIFAKMELPPLLEPPSLDDVLCLDFGVNDKTAFDKLFGSCMDSMASYVSKTVESSISKDSENETTPMNSGTFLAAPSTALKTTQEIEDHWKKPKTFYCQYCSTKLFSRVAWHHHQVCHTRANLKCKRCVHTTKSYSAYRRHYEYYHGAKFKRHVFFDSS